MAGNFGGEYILADWQFWEQSANISSAKTLQCAVIIIRNHSFHGYNGPAAGRASVIVGMEFTINSCVRGYHVSKGFWTPEVGEELACQCNPNDVYVVVVKTNAGVAAGHLPRKIGSLFSVSASEWYNQSKLAHGPVKFSARSISHFAMNIIMAKAFSTAKVNSAKCHNFSNTPKYLPAKISGHSVDPTLLYLEWNAWIWILWTHKLNQTQLDRGSGEVAEEQKTTAHSVRRPEKEKKEGCQAWDPPAQCLLYIIRHTLFYVQQCTKQSVLRGHNRAILTHSKVNNLSSSGMEGQEASIMTLCCASWSASSPRSALHFN